MIEKCDVLGEPQGRVGFSREGEYKGEFVFVFPEVKGMWGFYTSGGTDDILPDIDYLLERLNQENFEWLDPEMDESVEKSVFRMRPLGSQFEPDPSLFRVLARGVRSVFSRDRMNQ